MHGQSLAVSSCAFTGARAARHRPLARAPPLARRAPPLTPRAASAQARADRAVHGLLLRRVRALHPFVTAALVDRGQTYSEANGNAVAVMLSGFVFIEAIVELRGCGVTFGQMTASCSSSSCPR